MKTSSQWYKENPEKYEARKKQIKERSDGIRTFVQEYRKEKSCVSCGFSDYRAIDLHHRDPSEKIVHPSRIHLMGWSMARVVAELDKCDALCKNCHAILHMEGRMC